jgi:hypothetical protein
MYIERSKLVHCQQTEKGKPYFRPRHSKKEDKLPLRIYNINKTKKPDDKKSDQSEKQETENELENGNTEEREKNGQQVKIFLKITVFPHIRPAGIIFLEGLQLRVLSEITKLCQYARCGHY